MPPDTVLLVSRWFFIFLGALGALASLGCLHAEKKEHRSRLRSLPVFGTVGELLVLSGSEELLPQTWFPVSREGVLGSFRSCDLVVPCPGVRPHHLDYCWKDGIGLIIRPRSGCEVLVNGVPLDCRSDVSAYPLTHGSVLQVGQAVLRLQVLRALDHTVGEIRPPEEAAGYLPPESVPLPVPDAYYPPVLPPADFVPVPPPASPFPSVLPQDQQLPAVHPMPEEPVLAAPVPSPPRRRADRWKEDWSE